MVHVKRTQIYLEEDLDRDLRALATHEGRSAAALIREAVRSYIAAEAGRPVADPFADVIGAFSGGPREGAEPVDDFLYGAELR